MKEGYQTHANSERETKRGTSDPTYLVYTLGKLQILSSAKITASCEARLLTTRIPRQVSGAGISADQNYPARHAG